MATLALQAFTFLEEIYHATSAPDALNAPPPTSVHRAGRLDLAVGADGRYFCLRYDRAPRSKGASLRRNRPSCAG